MTTARVELSRPFEQSPVMLLPGRDPKRDLGARRTLPPSFGIMFSCTPPVSRSAPMPLVSATTSWKFTAFQTKTPVFDAAISVFMPSMTGCAFGAP
jgi:hypothetical protein